MLNFRKTNNRKGINKLITNGVSKSNLVSLLISKVIADNLQLPVTKADIERTVEEISTEGKEEVYKTLDIFTTLMPLNTSFILGKISDFYSFRLRQSFPSKNPSSYSEREQWMWLFGPKGNISVGELESIATKEAQELYCVLCDILEESRGK